MKFASFLLAATLLATVPAQASTPEAWAELFKRASTACLKASDLKKAKASAPVDFSDKVLIVVDGIYPQPHMKNAAGRFACLYDKATRKAETNELPR